MVKRPSDLEDEILLALKLFSSISFFTEGDNLSEILFAKGFGCVTDIEFHDGKMFVVSLAHGKIYEIIVN